VSLSKPELIVHPVRLRIVCAVQGRKLTSRQIGERLPGVPQATLYRQIKTLLDGGMLQVDSEHTVNGIAERVYSVPAGAAHLSRHEFAQISAEDHARYFAIFLGMLSAGMDRYLEQGSIDVVQQGMTYFQASLHLTDKQARQLRLDLLNLAKAHGVSGAGPGRRRHSLGVVFHPEPEETDPPADGADLTS
jgi:hypothetical protein